MPNNKPVLMDHAMPGEAWRHAPRTMPWDRPPQYTNVNQALTVMFKRFRQPQMTKQLLNMLDAGVPVDMLVQQMLMAAFRKGTIGAHMLVPMVGPLVVILVRMAESAGIHPTTSESKNKNVDFDPTDLLAARARSNNQANKASYANEKSVKDLTQKGVMDKQGFMQFRPVAKKGKLI